MAAMPRPAKTTAKPKADKEVSTRLDREHAVAQLVSAAITLLAAEGPTAIKARTVAEAAGLSTMAVYHHLGGLPELVQAVAEQGFDHLDEAFLHAPTTDDPVASLFAMALEARSFAQANPHLYDLMFGLSNRGTYRPATSIDRDHSDNFQKAYTRLVQESERLVACGRIRPGTDAAVVAAQLWSAVHGFIMLELGGHLSRIDDPVRHIFAPMMANIAVGLGDEPRLALASNAAAIATIGAT